jgi:aspartate-semialdehyde dehydrogenase
MERRRRAFQPDIDVRPTGTGRSVGDLKVALISANSNHLSFSPFNVQGVFDVFQTAAMVGATGAVGRIMLQLLEERGFQAETFKFLASARSAGQKLQFKGREYTIEELRPEAFAGVDLVISSTPDDVAAKYLPAAVEAGAVVIDESGYWRMKPEVALVVPEINPEAALNARGIIASPNCSTTQMVLALKPLHDAARVRRVIVSTYQAVSGAGLQGTADLLEGTRAHLDDASYEYQAFAHPIAFNAIPQIGSVKEDGYTSEELKMVYETRKILGDESIQINATCVRIPVANCHSESITVETERPISPDEARELFGAFPGLAVIDDMSRGLYPLPSTCTGRDEAFIGRIRRDLSHPNGLSFWCVSDNLRKGAATNAVQIAELLAAHRSAAARS